MEQTDTVFLILFWVGGLITGYFVCEIVMGYRRNKKLSERVKSAQQELEDTKNADEAFKYYCEMAALSGEFDEYIAATSGSQYVATIDKAKPVVTKNGGCYIKAFDLIRTPEGRKAVEAHAKGRC